VSCSHGVPPDGSCGTCHIEIVRKIARCTHRTGATALRSLSGIAERLWCGDCGAIQHDGVWHKPFFATDAKQLDKQARRRR
jgi:hypothetical protein